MSITERLGLSAMMITIYYLLPTALIAIWCSWIFDSFLTGTLVTISVPFTAFGITYHDTPKAIGSLLIALAILFTAGHV